MGAIDISLERAQHQGWEESLRSYLAGQNGLSERQALSHENCSLGHWLHCTGLLHYHQMPEMVALAKVHRELHELASEVVRLKHAGELAAAEEALAGIGPVTEDFLALLDSVERYVTVPT